MSNRNFKCTSCNSEFQTGEWMGCHNDPAQKHRVEKKGYFSASDGYVQVLRSDSTIYKPEGGGKLISIPGLTAKFIGGSFYTEDPEEQEILDRIGPKKGLMTHEQWVESRLTPPMREARQKALIADQKALIAQLQARLAAKDEKKDEKKAAKDDGARSVASHV